MACQATFRLQTSGVGVRRAREEARFTRTGNRVSSTFATLTVTTFPAFEEYTHSRPCYLSQRASANFFNRVLPLTRANLEARLTSNKCYRDKLNRRCNFERTPISKFTFASMQISRREGRAAFR